MYSKDRKLDGFSSNLSVDFDQIFSPFPPINFGCLGWLLRHKQPHSSEYRLISENVIGSTIVESLKDLKTWIYDIDILVE